MKLLLTTLIALGSVSPAFADQRSGYSEDRKCYKTEYREEYVPGTYDNPGYIRTFNETIEVPCRDGQVQHLTDGRDMRVGSRRSGRGASGLSRTLRGPVARLFVIL